MTIIDTPGLAAIDPERSEATTEFLGIASTRAVTQADALVYLMTGPPHVEDLEALKAFNRGPAGSTRRPPTRSVY